MAYIHKALGGAEGSDYHSRLVTDLYTRALDGDVLAKIAIEALPGQPVHYAGKRKISTSARGVIEERNPVYKARQAELAAPAYDEDSFRAALERARGSSWMSR
jgi:hypothetical protein